MEMVIGGAWQGKTAYAREHYPDVRFIRGERMNREELMQASGVLDFQDFVREELRRGGDVTDLAQELIRRNPAVIIITTEIGSGLVPVDPFERQWREETGRICTRLAAFSTRVVRIICGIPLELK